MKKDSCVYCGRSEDEHHAFQAPNSPEGCTCDPHEWGDPLNIPAACSSYVGDKDKDEYCGTCEHNRSCHIAEKARR